MTKVKYSELSNETNYTVMKKIASKWNDENITTRSN
jgi:hypothetical protein